MPVGLRSLSPIDPVQGVPVPLRIVYPTDAPATTHAFGPYTFEAALDAPIAGTDLPVVVISHGTGGTPWAYRGLTTALAEAGCVVVLVEHPGNSRADDSLANTPANLANRPRHVRIALDAVADLPVRSGATVVGHSMGGYTALAAAGGRPMSLPTESPDGVGRAIEVERDPRLRGVVLLAPALPWLMAPGALADVTIPILVRTGERDDLINADFIRHVLRDLAGVEHTVVPSAGHFFPCFPVPPALAGLPPAFDPPGFDRARYQPTLHADILAFVRESEGLGSVGG